MTHLLLNVDAKEHERAEKSRFLEQSGFTVIEAATEAEALRLVLDRRPTVVIVNTRLPHVDGYRLGRQIKAHPDASGSFVLLLAPAFEGPTPPLEQIADAFLPAPPYYPALLAQIRLVIRLAEASCERARTETTLQGFYDSAPYMMGIAEADGDSIVTVSSNAATARFAGGPTGTSTLWIEHAKASAAAGQPVRFLYQHESPDGVRWLDATVTAFPTTDARRTRFNFIVEDVTERTERDDALRTSEERLRVALAATRLGTWEWNAATDAVICDHRAAELYDLAPSAPVSWQWMLEHRIHPDDRPETLARVAAAANGDGWYRATHRVVHQNGSVGWVQASGQMLFDRPETPRRVVRLVGTTEDVTVIKQAERALRESEGRLRELIEALPLLAWTCEPGGACDYLSPQWVEYTGIGAARQLGLGWLEQVHPDDQDRVQTAWRASVVSGDPLAVEFRIRRRDGQYCWFDTRAVPIAGADGRIAKWLGINMNVDARKRAEESLLDADRRKDEFLAMLSHELRNPLAPIRNSVALLRQARHPDPVSEHARDVIDRQVSHLTKLVDDLLDVSRITQGKVRLVKAPISLVTAIERAVEMTRPYLESRRIALTVALGPDPLPVDADLTRLVQSVGNLLHNAAKFTPEGGTIDLTAQAVGGEAVVRVNDHGVGIQADLLPHVFDLFTQGDHPLDRSQGGLGIGLTIVKAIVELHGGQVEATSPGPNEGSQFVIHLPLAVAPSATNGRESTERQANPGGFKVLVVDDNRDGAESLALLLGLEGYDVRIARDGLAAIDTAIAFEPAIVILDIGLPGMDGYEVARQLRADSSTARVLLIALTGYGREQDKSRAIAAGFDHYLVKPVDPEQLQALIGGYRDQETAPT